MEPDNRLRLMKKKLAELPDTAKKEEQFRQRVWYAACGMAALCAGISLLYLLNRENFTSWDLETVMGSMLVHILPWILLAFAGFIAASCLCRRSMEREIQLLRGLTGSPAPAAKETPSRVNTVRIALYALAAILIVLGIQNGGMRDVLIKAINICTECIGLG